MTQPDAFEVAVGEFTRTYSLEQLEDHLEELKKRDPNMPREIAFFEKVVERKIALELQKEIGKDV